MIEWYKTLNVDNRHCSDVYWEEKVDGEVARVVNRGPINRGPMVVDDEDLPF